MTTQQNLAVVEEARANLARPLSVAEVKAHVNLVQEVLRGVMKDGTHYGIIPGTQKPTLYKAGSEQILVTFRLGVDPEVIDLTTGDEIRYRVACHVYIQATNQRIGTGVGEASTSEEKYRWRAAVCQEEFDETPEDRRRKKWQRKREGGAYQINQVRTQPADLANTVLKMAKKRAQIDATLTTTAASDVFAQDLEDLPDEIRAAAADEPGETKPPIQPPQRKSEPAAARAPSSTPANGGGDPVISEAQAKRFYAIAMQAGWQADELKGWLQREYGLDDDRKIPRKRYDEIVKAVQDASGN